ncbi:MAG TPA: ABC transporter ATP-binding protein [Methylomirabilota bacterium]|jgi:ABC-type multidrug transport system ATPase subunit|nr:ABC transporter ATP-binding protein [Methylomirabilota bacterium]
MIELDRVGCRIGGRWALEDVTLRVEAGELVGLEGPNGGGKSLLLAVCATLVRPDAGRVVIAGQDARSRAAAVRAVVGYVGESVGFYPDMTVGEDLEFFGRASRLTRADAAAAARAILGRLGLLPAAGVRMAEASRGLLRKIALARALVHQPRVLLLDDPGSGVDADGCAALWRELRRHVEDGGAALVAGGDGDLLRHARRIAVLREGRLHQEPSLVEPA